MGVGLFYDSQSFARKTLCGLPTDVPQLFFALGYGYWILHEPITWDRFLAVVLMGIGVCLISYER